MKTVPPALLSAATDILRPYWPDLTETRLVRGIISELQKPGQQVTHTDEWLTVKDFCATVKCSRTFAWRLVKEGRIRQVRLGKNSVRIPAAELVRLAGGGGAE